MSDGVLTDWAFEQVRRAVIGLVAGRGYTAEDREDIRQDLLMHLFENLHGHDESKSDYKLYVTCLIDHKLKNIIRDRNARNRKETQSKCSHNKYPRFIQCLKCNKTFRSKGNRLCKACNTANSQIKDAGYPNQSGRWVTCPDKKEAQGQQPESTDMYLDTLSIIPELPFELRRIAELLQTHTPAETARELGMPNSTLQRKIAKLRKAFELAGVTIQPGE